MYIVEVDRPWLETPFLFQGFPVNTPHQLKEVRKNCRYVYINPEIKCAKGSFTPVTKRILRPGVTPKVITQLKGFLPYPKSIPFEQEIETSRTIHRGAREAVDQMFQDIRMGKNIDAHGTKVVVKNLVKSVIRNPDTLMWLTHLKNRDEYTAIHSMNVCILSLTFGRHLGLSEETLNLLGIGAIMHDIGKIRVPLAILNKPGKLTDKEFALMRHHPKFGVEILGNTKEVPQTAVEVAYNHHERIDGSGYPRQLTKNAINLFGKMVAIVDVYDAISSDRSYHTGISTLDAMRQLYDCGGVNFDQVLLEQFIQCIGIYPIGSLVELNTGEVGIVVSINVKQRLKPKVMLILNADKKPLSMTKLINLVYCTDNDSSSYYISNVLEQGSYNINLRNYIQTFK